MPTATSYLLKANKLVARIMGRMGVAMLPNVAFKNWGHRTPEPFCFWFGRFGAKTVTGARDEQHEFRNAASSQALAQYM